MNEFTIHNSKRKLLQLSLLGLVMFFSSLYVLYFSIKLHNIINGIISILGAIFFGSALIYTIKSLVKPKPMMIINNDGIMDNSTATSIGFIPWSTIVSFKVEKHFGTKYIGVEVNNTEELLRTLPLLKKLNVKFNIRTNSAPLLINIGSSCALECDEVLAILNEQFELKNKN